MNACRVNGSVTTMLTVLIEVTKLGVVQIHSLTVLMGDVSSGIHGVTETMIAETIAMKMNVQVEIYLYNTFIAAFQKGS